MTTPTVSVIVTTYNWKEALLLTLKSLLHQTVLPTEIIVADDGSLVDTKQIVDIMAVNAKVPIRHVWQEDIGFRRTPILNKAIANAASDYIIQIDGDLVLEKHFIADHLEQAEPNYFVCGSRVMLSHVATQKILNHNDSSVDKFNLPFLFAFNCLRFKALRLLLAKRYGKNIEHMRGCNMAYWKKDALLVNGYNEDILQWGYEDHEFAYRLYFAGVKKKCLKMGGVQYHLFHSYVSRENVDNNRLEKEKTVANRSKYCKNGIDKYL